MSTEPDEELVYLSFEDALEIYGAIIGGTAQQAADQLRSRDALEGALGRPASYAHYEQADMALQAAVLAHGIAQSQSFIDGNKRVGLAVALAFLCQVSNAVGKRLCRRRCLIGVAIDLDFAAGDELLGLQRGLFCAGASSLLLSLWDVHDQSTAELMRSFYKGYTETGNMALSLQDAMKHLRQQNPHPYFWAPFVLVGQLAVNRRLN